MSYEAVKHPSWALVRPLGLLYFKDLRESNVARPVGSKTKKSTHMVRDVIDEASRLRTDPATKREGLLRLTLAQFDAAMGIEVHEPDAQAIGGQRIYTIPPNPAAAKMILEHRFGRAKETIEVTEKGSQHKKIVIVVPQI